MLFRRRRKKAEKLPPSTDKQVHRVFQLCALFLLGFIIYNLYFSDSAQNLGNQPTQLEQQRINQGVKDALEKMSENSEYKKLKAFVDRVESSFDKDKAGTLKTPEGILIFIPDEILNQEKGNIEVNAENYKINFSVTKNIPEKTTPNLPEKDTIGPEPALKSDQN